MIYKNPPLVEAVFELFYSSNSWSPIIPGLFYNEIKNQFPNITQKQSGFGIIEGLGLKIGGGNGEMTQYKNSTNDTIIQLSGNLLTVNKLPKYNGWESYSEIIIFAIKALNSVLEINRIERMGLKTINKVDIGNHSLEQLKKYFKIYPFIPEEMDDKLNSIQMILESPISEDKEILAIQLSTLRKEQNYQAPVLFQIYVTRIKDIPDNYIDWLEQSHIILSETFEKSITTFSKERFDHE